MPKAGCVKTGARIAAGVKGIRTKTSEAFSGGRGRNGGIIERWRFAAARSIQAVSDEPSQ
jgi:hypothetical protein